MRATDKLTAHFTAGELGADIAPAAYLTNLRNLAVYLEVVRNELGVRLVKVSGYRTPARNIAVRGSKTSSHLIGSAADFQPEGLSTWAAYNKLKAAKAAGRLPDFDQIILYPFQHLHIGLGPQMRNEFRIKLREGQFALDTTLPPDSGTTPSLTLTQGQTDVVALTAIAFVSLAIIIAMLA